MSKVRHQSLSSPIFSGNDNSRAIHPAALGSQITIDDHKLTIIGVAPPRFNGTDLDATEVWVPIATFFSAPTPGRAFWWQDPNAKQTGSS